MLIKIYKAMLAMGPFKVKKSGKVMISLSDKDSVPFEVNGKPVYLPLKKVLRSSNKSYELFHPLRENVMAGPPATLIAWRNVVISAISNIYIPNLVKLLHTLNSMSKEGEDISAKTSLVLSDYSKVNDNDLKHCLAMLRDSTVLEIALEHNKAQGKVTSTTTSPLLMEIHETLAEKANEYAIGNVKVTKKSLLVMKSILNKVFDFKDSSEAAKRIIEIDTSVARSTLVLTSALSYIIINLNESLGVLSSAVNMNMVLPDAMKFLDYDLFEPENKKKLLKLVREVATNSDLAKKKRKKKKKHKDVYAKGILNTPLASPDIYGLSNASAGDSKVDAELLALRQLTMASNPQMIPPNPIYQAPQANSIYASTGQVDQFGLPLPNVYNDPYGTAPLAGTGQFDWSL